MLGPMESVDAPDASALIDFGGDLRELDDPLGTRFLPEDEPALHFFDAPSARTLNEAGKCAALEFQRIVEAAEGTPSPKEET
jgi:hypothetical protein